MTPRTSRRDRDSLSAPPAARTPASPDASEPRPGRTAERLAYSVDEAASLTGLSRDLLYDEMRRGNLAYLKVGRRRLITRHHLEQFLEITASPGRLRGTTESPQRTGPGAL